MEKIIGRVEKWDSKNLGENMRYNPKMKIVQRPRQANQTPPVLREELGEVLRLVRQRKGLTLREISASAKVSLGYLSEVERGQKEASSELLAAICSALRVPLAVILREVSERIAIAEGIYIPDTVPEELIKNQKRRKQLVASE